VSGYGLSDSFKTVLSVLCLGTKYSAQLETLKKTPYAGSGKAADIKVNFTAKEATKGESVIDASYSCKYKMACEDFRKQIVPLLKQLPKEIKTALVTVTEKVTRVGDVPSKGGDHLGGERYQAAVTSTGSLINRNDNYEFENVYYQPIDKNSFISVEQTTKAGTEMKGRYNMIFAFQESDGTCVTVTSVTMRVSNLGSPNVVADNVKQVIQTQIQRGFDEVAKK
ncbi:MAG: hypothetical protein HQK54_07690, partial [Oligoflexales bacterium]|nr:hypothetical protein [Oligoflexales bacterium]